MAQGSQNLPYVFFGGCIIAAIVIGFVIVVPQYGEVGTLEGRIAELSQERAAQQSFLDTLDRKSQQLRAESRYEQELGVILPAQRSIDDVLRIVDRKASESGVVIAGITNISESTASGVRAARVRGESVVVPNDIELLGVNLAFTGSYQQTRQFLDALSRSARLIDITKISMSTGANGGEILGVEVILNFYGYAPQ